MSWTSRLAVHPHFCVCHRAIENEVDYFAFPGCWNNKLHPILSLFASNRVSLPRPIAAVVVTTEALQFPTRRNGDLRPDARAASACAKEIPLHCIVFSSSGQIASLCQRTFALGVSREERNSEEKHHQH